MPGAWVEQIVGISAASAPCVVCHLPPVNHSTGPMWFLPLVPPLLLFPSYLVAFGQNLLVSQMAHGSLPGSAVTRENLPEEASFLILSKCSTISIL